MPKKYNSINDVRLQEVIDHFPLTQNSDSSFYYVLRFETIISLSTSKKISVWVDISSFPTYDI